MAQYQGHRSWNAWNVSLWINNDEELYRMARDYYLEGKRRYNIDRSARQYAARRFVHDMAGCKTPDGGVYNRACVYEALEEMLD